MSAEKDNSILSVDVNNILKQKNPRLHKRLPGFVINLLKRIVHEKEINEFLSKYPGVQDMEFVRAVLEFMDVTYEFEGLENIPEGGRYVFAANHPLGGLESLVMMEIISTKFEKFVFVVNDILMTLKQLSNLFLPVNKHGSQSRDSLKKLNECYASDIQILFFPAGLVSRRQGRIIKDLKWQKTFIVKAVEYQRDIVPVFIEGRNSGFFYFLANFRKFLGIKANIEMLFLPHEMFKQKGKTIRFVFGKPISYRFFDDSKSFTEWAAYLRELTYSMQKK